MELKEFVSKVITDVVVAIEETSSNLGREIYLKENDKARTVEFDVAVMAETMKSGEGKSGVKVLELVDIGGNMKKENKNTTVSRVKFGVHVSSITKKQEQDNIDTINRINQQHLDDLQVYD